jgi:hypothetical protein
MKFIIPRGLRTYFLAIVMLASSQSSHALQPGFNYEEAMVPEFTLPDPLITADGSKVISASDWPARRAEIMRLFQLHVYGRRPAPPKNVGYKVQSVDKSALGGKAIRKQVAIQLKDVGPGFDLNVLMYLPAKARGPVPVFLGYNFGGNQSINSDPGILMTNSWTRNGRTGYENNRANEQSRGASASRWPVEKILERGYGLVTLYYGDVEPDHDDGWKDGIRNYLRKDEDGSELDPEDWSAISVWSWGLSRVVDYLETDDAVNASKVSLLGHSRLGKTSLWGGASDERFALVISNDSGCGGAALSRRAFGETVERINTSFPHWFCQRFKTYNSNENALPVDQHMLIAMMAPRPVYVASAQEDLWADPNGEFMSAKLAGPVYQLFGLKGVGVDKQPAIHKPVGGSVGYHIRAGVHDVTDYDWEQYLNFADRHLK